jgi:hypothetical protein
MRTAVLLIGAILAIAVVVLARRTLPTWWKWRGKRIVRCPETLLPVGVEVDARRAALRGSLGERGLQLQHCSRWPERAGCGQECLTQIESAPYDCLVRNIVARWYDGASCACCGKVIGPISWGGHDPGLLSPDGVILQWSQIAAESLTHVLESHSPVCWDCYIVENVRRKHPELITDRSTRRA